MCSGHSTVALQPVIVPAIDRQSPICYTCWMKRIVHFASKVLEFFAGLHAWVRWFFDPEEVVVGRWCGMCDTVHQENESCPREVIRWCMDCQGWVSVNRYFLCPSGHHRDSIHPDLRRDPFWDRCVETQPLIAESIMRTHLRNIDRKRRRKELGLRVIEGKAQTKR